MRRTKRNVSPFLRWVLCAAALAVAGASLAQEQSGTIEGRVRSPASGGELPRVTVQDDSGFMRQVIADEQGFYRLPAVPPGLYAVTVECEGFSPITRTAVSVAVGSRRRVDFDLSSRVLEETIEVSGEAPAISMAQSDTSVVIGQDWFESLPTARDFTSIVSQTAAAQDEADLLGGISIDGASGAENRFYVDGTDTTHLLNGTSKKTLITDFLDEVQVKAAGYNAEFGGSTGGVISAITRSGTNQLKGGVHAYYEKSDLPIDRRRDSGGSDGRRLNLEQSPGGSYFSEVLTDDTDEWDYVEPGFSLGGPLARDRAWFFVGYSPVFRRWTRRPSFPQDGGLVRSFEQKQELDYGTANLTASLGQLFLKLSYNTSDQTQRGSLPGVNGDGPGESLSSSDPDAYDIDTDNPNESYSLNVDWLATANFSVNLRAGHFEFDTRASGFYTGDWHTFVGDPVASFPGFPPELAAPRASPRAEGTAFDFFERDVLNAEVTFFTRWLGEHEIKLGGSIERIGNRVLDGYVNTRVLFYWDRSFANLDGERVRGTYGTLRVLQIATQGEVEAENSALFLQDSWRPTDRLTLNLGIRAEKERIPSFADNPSIPETAIAFDFDDKLAPRLGFAYDLKGDGRWKLFGSYGVFYDNTKLEMPRGLFGGAKWVDWFFGLETFDWPSLVESCKIERNSIAAPPPAGCGEDFLFAVDRRFPANDPANPTIDPNLEPFESTEISLGLEYLMTPRTLVGLRYVHKEIVQTIEDVGVLDRELGAEVFFIANPGEGVAQRILGPTFPAQPEAVRDYDAVTLWLRKNFDGRWALNASYTYSELRGNYSGLASSDEDGRLSPNVNRFFDGLPSSFDASGSGRPVFGELATDRPHQFKAQLIYHAPWGA